MAIIRDLPMHDYHQSDAISKTKLQTYAKHGAQHYYREYVKRDLPKVDKPAFAIGRAFDDLMCTGAKSYVVKPEGFDGRTSAGKAWIAENSGRDVLSAEDDRMLDEMRQAFMGNRFAHPLWSACDKQVSLRRELPALGVSVQSRPDGINLPGKTLVDIKTCRDLNRFSRDCLEFGYNLQIALGQWIAAQEGHQLDAYLIVVEAKLAPRCKVLRMRELALAAGWNRCKALIEKIAAHYKSGEWNDDQAEIEDIEIEAWQERKLEADAA